MIYKYRIKQVINNNNSWYFPQIKRFVFWCNFKEIVEADTTCYIRYVDLAFKNFDDANNYIKKVLLKEKTIYHYL